jgi:hypothetical protein
VKDQSFGPAIGGHHVGFPGVREKPNDTQELGINARAMALMFNAQRPFTSGTSTATARRYMR